MLLRKRFFTSRKKNSLWS